MIIYKTFFPCRSIPSIELREFRAFEKWRGEHTRFFIAVGIAKVPFARKDKIAFKFQVSGLKFLETVNLNPKPILGIPTAGLGSVQTSAPPCRAARNFCHVATDNRHVAGGNHLSVKLGAEFQIVDA